VLPAGLLLAAVAADPAVAVPASLVDSTLKAGARVAAGVAIADVASGPVASLVTGASRTMLWTKGAIIAACVLGVGGIGLGGLGQRTGGAGTAAAPIAGEPEQPPAKADPPKAEPKEQKTYEIEFRNKPWGEVLEWYGEIVGLPFVGTVKPTGSLTLVGTKGKRYTLEEVTDLLNEALLAQKFILVRRATSFTVLPADEKIDPTLIPLVRLDELNKRGRTELVRVVIPLTNVNAVEVAPDIEKLLGPFGRVVPLNAANQLVVTDTAGNLRLIVQTITDIEARAADKKKDVPEKK
jgi:type II secretory pathway component GspD/PulD (secretin)